MKPLFNKLQREMKASEKRIRDQIFLTAVGIVNFIGASSTDIIWLSLIQLLLGVILIYFSRYPPAKRKPAKASDTV